MAEVLSVDKVKQAKKGRLLKNDSKAIVLNLINFQK
jgi:hypothetical protein